MRFKKLERKPYQVEQEYSLYFIPGLNFCEKENELQQKRRDEQKIIPGKSEERNIVRCEQEHEKRACKDTGPCFFNAECQEFNTVCFQLFHMCGHGET